MTERERIIAGFSPSEREFYEAIGGKIPRVLKPIAPQTRYETLVESVRCEAVPRWFKLERERRSRVAAVA